MNQLLISAFPAGMLLMAALTLTGTAASSVSPSPAPSNQESLEVERMRLRFEVARLQLERGQALADASPEAQLQWQVSLLDNEVSRLNEEVLRKPPAARYEPWWWY